MAVMALLGVNDKEIYTRQIKSWRGAVYSFGTTQTVRYAIEASLELGRVYPLLLVRTAFRTSVHYHEPFMPKERQISVTISRDDADDKD